MSTKKPPQENLPSKHPKTKLFFFVILSLFAVNNVFAQQTVVVKAKNISLNKVMTNLRDQYDVKLSFNDDKLSQYYLDVDKSFSSVDEALHFLLKDLPLHLEKTNGVFIISSQKANSNKKYLLAGHIVDGSDLESLPYTSIIVNGYPLTTDQKGNFSYLAQGDSTFNFEASYLGYYKLDTNVSANTNLEVKLYQSTILIKEVVLTSRSEEKAMVANSAAGDLKLNHTVGQDLPGSSDNSVYNTLRLQPGILAAGEKTNDLIVWGSYRGQTKVSFDGFTIFGLKNFNDDIGAINPLMAKDVTVKKGGYGVDQGDRVGGVVNITGVEGSTRSPSVKISLNNLTLNAIASTPLFKNTTLVLAGRQTYYNLYDSFNFNASQNNRNGAKNMVDLTVKPDYTFKDLNLKFSGRSLKGDDFYLSLFSGSDKLKSSYLTQQDKLQINGSNDEHNNQFGGAAFYSKKWKNGSISNVTVASSGLKNDDFDNIQINQIADGKSYNNISALTTNKISENSVKFAHKLAATKKNNLSLGAGFIDNQTNLNKDSANVNEINEERYSDRLFSYLEDAYFITPNFKITPGFRADFDLNLQKLFFQPRLSASYNFTDAFNITTSWGLYHQFIAYNGVKNDEGDFQYQWTVSDGKEIPVYSAQHWVLGTSYEHNRFTFNIDAYYKTTTGITRFIDSRQGRYPIQGDGRSFGIDFLVKKEYQNVLGWVSYSLSSTQERFNAKKGFISSYQRAPQDQRHEIKFAGLLKLSPFYFSANYVYGSGFPNMKPMNERQEDQLVYNRFDTAITYKFSAKKYRLEAGASILNLFNTQNIKAENLERIPTQQSNTVNIYSQTVPFTPTIFLSFSL